MRSALGLALVLLLAAPPLLAQEAGEAPIPRTQNAREVRSLVVALGSEDWGTREAARERLIEIGPEALPYLQRAARDPDPERAAIARELLETLRWLVPEDLRQALGDDFDDFPALPLAQRKEAVGALLERAREAPSAATRYLITIARFDPDSSLRQLAVWTFLRIPRGDPRLDQDALTALADEPDQGAELPYIRARLLQRLGRLDEAIAAVRISRQRAPQGREPLVLFADLLLEAERPQEALEPLARARELAPQDVELQILYGEALARAGQKEEGLAELRAVLEREESKQNEQIMVRLGRAFLRAGLHDEARLVYKEALGRFPYSRELNMALGDLLLESGQVAAALEIYLNEISYSQPETALFFNLRERLTRILTEGGAGWIAEVDAFFTDAQRGRQVRDVRREVGRWLRRRGLFEEAAQEFRLVAALSPGQAEPLILLGDALRDGGDPAGARRAYLRAKELAPESPLPMARLRDVGDAAQRAVGPGATEGSFAFWETRVEPRDLAQGAESVAGGAPPPLVLDGRVVVSANGCTSLYGFDAVDGRYLWSYEPEPPEPSDGALPEQIGLQVVSVLSVPSAVVAAADPRRARQRRPLVAALANVYWRPANRSWRKARFMGLRVYLLDPDRGEHVAVIELDDPAQILLPPAPVVRGGRALVFSSQGRRMNLESIDLILGRPLWRARVPRQTMQRPLLAGDRALVAWSRGVVAVDRSGGSLWRHDRNADPSQAEAEGQEPPAPLTTPLALSGDRALFGTADGRLIALALEDGAATELARPSESRLTGLVAWGDRVFLSARGGRVHALALGDEVTELWTNPGPKAAARTLAWAGGILFGINGSDDVFADEEPSLQALDPETGQVRFQRPVERPAVLAAGEELVVVASGGRGARGGLRVLGARPSERIDAVTARMLELESAARDALAEEQFEVSSVLAREYVRRSGGPDRLGRESLAFVARTLVKSRRHDEALDLIHQAENRGGSGDTEFWALVLRDLGLEQPIPELEPKAGEPGEQEPGEQEPGEQEPGEQEPGEQEPDEEAPEPGTEEEAQ